MAKSRVYEMINWASNTNKTVFRQCGAFDSVYSCFESIDMARDVMAKAAEHKVEYVDRKTVVDDGIETSWGCLFEHGALGGLAEHVLFYDPAEVECSTGFAEYNYSASKNIYENKFGLYFEDGAHAAFADQWGQVAGFPSQWNRKIKKAFDPEDISDSTWYVKPEPDPDPED